jgi:hypothetical protein
MSNLGGREIYKYEWRTNLFIKKMEEGSPFELTSGKSVILLKNKNVISHLKNGLPTTNITLLDASGSEHKFKDLKKSTEFGGKGEGFSVRKEDIELSNLIEKINYEKAKISSATIQIKIGNRIYDVFGAETTKGTPKSDFHLIDINGDPIVWISHKDGKTPKDFQQWGGISQAREPIIFNHTETQSFIKDLKESFPSGLPRATTVYRKIKDKKLKMFSVYGNKFGNKFGEQNVTILLQGPVSLQKNGKYYTFKSNNIHLNGESVDADGFEPVLMAIYKGDRSDVGVKGTRIVISPINSRRGVPF